MSTVVTASRYRLPSARKVWLNVHFYLGLSAGLALALIGLSGALLVFLDPMVEMEVGHKTFAVSGPPPLHAAVDQWIANAQRTYADIGTVDMAMGPGFAISRNKVADLRAVAPGGKHWTITIDPASGAPLGRFFWEDTYTFWLLRFHTSLASRISWSGDLVAWLGVAMIVSMLTGLYLWWPRNRNWRVALTLKRGAGGRRRLLDLHNLFAVYLYVPLFILAFTGVYFLKPYWIDPVISLASVERTPDAEALARISKPGSCGARTTPGQAVAVAQARFPTAKFVYVLIPTEPGQPYRVNLAPPNNLDDKGQTQVFVDPECPVILTAIDGEVRRASETFKAVVFPLHRDMMLGRFGSVMVFLSGALMPISFVTGLLLWLDKRKSRNRRPA